MSPQQEQQPVHGASHLPLCAQGKGGEGKLSMSVGVKPSWQSAFSLLLLLLESLKIS